VQHHEEDVMANKTSQPIPAVAAKQKPVAKATDRTAVAPTRGVDGAASASLDLDNLQPTNLLTLQRTIGNSATTRLIQTKLNVGPAGDRYEQEADRVAAQVMTMPASAETQPALQRAPDEEEELQMKPLAAPLAASITPLVQRAPEEEEELQMKPLAERVQRVEEEEELQAKPDVQRASSGAGFEVGGEFEQQLAASRGGGSPLSAEVRSFMEPRFGADFSGVRIHTGGESARLNRSVSAQAFTLGQDIYLGEGKSDVESDAGKSLLAHELTHVVQQNGSMVQRLADTNQPGRSLSNVETAVEETIQRVGPVITAEPKAGTSIHPTLSMGAANNKDAVMELQQKLATAAGSSSLITPSGVFDAATKDAVSMFQRKNGLTVNGVVDKATWDALDTQGKSNVGRVERTWEQIVGGATTGMTSQYTWRIERKRVVVSVGINFVADATHPPADMPAKKTQLRNSITDKWNRFKAVNAGTGESRKIVFEVVEAGGNTVTLINGAGVSDASHWYWGDVIQFPNVPAHEFGHLISLEDEYQRPEAAYRRLHPEATPDQITQARGAAGDYTDDKAMMGMGSIVEHPGADNDPEPRHVREFVKFLEKAEGGTWEAQRA
jgi:hypothetical protein